MKKLFSTFIVVLIVVILVFSLQAIGCSSGNQDTGVVGDKYMNLTVTPFLYAKPGDTLTVKVEVGTGYNTHLTGIKLIPEAGQLTEWPSQWLFNRDYSWPGLMNESSVSVHVTDSKTFKVKIPESATIPLDLEFMATFEYAQQTGAMSFGVQGASASRKCTLGELTHTRIEDTFHLIGFAVISHGGFKCRVSYQSMLDTSLSIIDGEGKSWSISDQRPMTRAGSETQKLLKKGTNQEEAWFTEPGWDIGHSSNKPLELEKFTIEIRERYTNLLLLRRPLADNTGTAIVHSANVTWTYDQNKKAFVISKVDVNVQNTGSFPFSIQAAIFKTESSPRPYYCGGNGLVSPGDNGLEYYVYIMPAAPDTVMDISLFAGFRGDYEKLVSLSPLDRDKYRIATYQFRIATPASPQ